MLHVQAMLNEIDGYTHDRSRRAPVPTLFGFNYQSISVGEKLKGNGYTDVLGTPSAGLQAQLAFVDQTLGMLVSELKKQGIYDSTLIIVGAKHGQSPIDVQKRVEVGGGEPAATIGSSEAFDLGLADLANGSFVNAGCSLAIESAWHPGSSRHPGDFCRSIARQQVGQPTRRSAHA